MQEKPRNRKQAILQVLRSVEMAMNMEDLCERANQLHSCQEGPAGYRKTVVYLGNKEGIWQVSNIGGKEVVSLTTWIEELGEKKAAQPQTVVEPISEAPKVVSGNGIEIIEPDPENFIFKKTPPFLDFFECFPTLEAHEQSGENLIYQGPPGEGKTLGVFAWAVKKRYPIVVISCTNETKAYDLIGMPTVIGDQVKFVLGGLTQAIVLANKCGNAILLLDELNALNEKTQKILNTLDWRRQVYIPKIEKLYKLNQGCRLIVAATQNPIDATAGVNELNPELLTRFSLEEIDYPNAEEEMKIVDLEDILGEFDQNFKERLIRLANETRAYVKNEGFGYPISTRCLHRFLRNFRAYKSHFTPKAALAKAVKNTFYNKMVIIEQREWFREKVFRVLDVTMPA